MDILHRQTPPSSSLNPNAPAFIPMSYYDAIEDFSDQWWSLVQSSPWFRDYWLNECFEDPEADAIFPAEEDLFLPDPDSIFDDCIDKHAKRSERELVSTSALMWNSSKARGKVEAPRYSQKSPKFVNIKVNPRPIQQPR